MRRVGERVALLVVAALCSAPAAAIVYVMPTDESMVARSEVIVFGEVRSATPAPAGRLPSTDFSVEVVEALRGFVPGGTIVVRQPGGSVAGGRAMKVIGLPMLAEGDRVLLFLDPVDGVYRPVELGLGMFFEVRVGDRLLLVREPSLRGEAPAASGEQARSRQPRDAANFRRWIADRAAGSKRQADYFETDPLDQPLSVAAPFRVTRSPAECFHDGLPLRWREFDRGQSVGVTVQASSQPGVPGGGLPEVRTAIGVWNDDPGSRIDLVLEGVSNRELPVSEDDEINSISYEDPFDEIPGSYRGGGGVLAITYAFFYCNASRTPHAIPGNDTVEALALVEANITTQDGYEDWVSSRSSPSRAHEEIVGHELGHLLGISHPCGDLESGPCDTVGGQALMRARVHGDGRGAALNSDDRNAALYLYPAPGRGGTGPTPYPEPPSGAGYTDCRPAATPLVFEDGYEVSMCYETPDGDVGEAKAGIWSSGESGLLWFFNRDNAEVLVKVLDGCRLGGHRWAFVAPVTDLAFNLHIRDSVGRYWSHHNRQGDTAATRTDNFAFKCD